MRLKMNPPLLRVALYLGVLLLVCVLAAFCVNYLVVWFPALLTGTRLCLLVLQYLQEAGRRRRRRRAPGLRP